jgi:hypothetical protein
MTDALAFGGHLVQNGSEFMFLGSDILYEPHGQHRPQVGPGLWPIAR